MKSQEIEVDNILMNVERFEVFVNGVKQGLTLKEFELLRLLLINKGKVFTRDSLLDRVWGYDCSQDTRTVDVHIRHLRQKIEEDPASPRYIETIRGVGYRFRDNHLL